MLLFLFLFFLLFSFFTPHTYASVIVDFVDSTQTLDSKYVEPPADSSNCSAVIPPPPPICSNSDRVNSTTCSEPACTDGKLWSKYGLSGCYKDKLDPTNYAWVYKYDTVICSIADKCGDINGNNVGPTLNAGFCDCTVGGIYKTCCSGNNVSSSSCVQQSLDTTNPPFEGVCPAGTTTEPCGSDPAIYAALGKPFTNVACGQAACAQLAPPPPASTRYNCVNNSCVQDTTGAGTYPDLTTCNANCNTQCPNFAPPAQITQGSCAAGTTCVAQQKPAKVDGSCSPGSSCTRQCSFTCVDSLGHTCPATTCTTVWACDAAGSGYVNGGQYYYTCPANCSVCTPGQTQTICQSASTCHAP